MAVGLSLMLFLFYILAIMSLAHAEVLSVSKTDLVSNAPELDGKTAWFVLMSAGTSERIVGRVDSSQIKDPETGATAKHSFEISIGVDDYQCDYAVRQQEAFETKIFEAKMFETEKEGYYDSCPYDVQYDCAHRSAIGGPRPLCGVKEHYTRYIIKTYTRFYCIYFEPIASTYALDTPNQNFIATIKITRDDGAIENLKISSGGALTPEESKYNVGVTAKSSDGNVYVNWVGYLSLGKGCPNPANYRAVFMNGEWFTTSADYVDKYVAAYSDLATCVVTIDSKYVENCLSSYNYYAHLATSRVPIQTADALDRTKTAEYTEVEGKAHFVLHLDTLLQSPVFRFLIFADWLGVFIPQGKPKILKVEPNQITSGTQNIYVQVQNLADVEDTFNVYINCDNYIAKAYNKVTIPPHQARWVALRVTASANYERTANCVVVAENSLGTESDSYKIGITVKPIGYCTPGTMRCNGNVIEKCNEAGTAWIKVQECSYGCKETASGPVCYAPQDRDGDGIPDDVDKCPDEYGYPIYDGCPKPKEGMSKLTWVLLAIAVILMLYVLVFKVAPWYIIHHYLGGGRR